VKLGDGSPRQPVRALTDTVISLPVLCFEYRRSRLRSAMRYGRAGAATRREGARGTFWRNISL
jgi:hypothetical protein